MDGTQRLLLISKRCRMCSCSSSPLKGGAHGDQGGKLMVGVAQLLWSTRFGHVNPQLWNRGGFYRNDKSQLQPTVMWWLPTNFGFFHSRPDHGSRAHFVEACVLDSYISINVNVNYYNPYILAITMIWSVFCLKRLQKALCIIYYRVHYKNGSKHFLSIIYHVKAALSANEHTHGANGFYDQVTRS